MRQKCGIWLFTLITMSSITISLGLHSDEQQYSSGRENDIDKYNHYLKRKNEEARINTSAIEDYFSRTRLTQEEHTGKGPHAFIMKAFQQLLCRILGQRCQIFSEAIGEESMSPVSMTESDTVSITTDVMDALTVTPPDTGKNEPTSVSITSEVIDSLVQSITLSPAATPSTSLMNDFSSSLVTLNPSLRPSIKPTVVLSKLPSSEPSLKPTMTPTMYPTALPSEIPSHEPTNVISSIPTFEASHYPSMEPSAVPSNIPSDSPSSFPSNAHSTTPSSSPSIFPSYSPSNHPSTFPTPIPTYFPSSKPSSFPTTKPSSKPSSYPSSSPSSKPSVHPSHSPTDLPSQYPSYNPSSKPSSSPTDAPTVKPSNQPSGMPIAEMEMCHFSIDIQDSDCSSHIVSNHDDRAKRTINRDEYICSLNKRYRFGLTTDENLCLCDGDRKLWCADECCQRGNDPYAVFEEDGNLVVYSDKNRLSGLRRDSKLWESGKGLGGPTKIKIFNNGDVSIFSTIDESAVSWKAEKDNWNYM